MPVIEINVFDLPDGSSSVFWMEYPFSIFILINIFFLCVVCFY